jgi:hypothetical protein
LVIIQFHFKMHGPYNIKKNHVRYYTYSKNLVPGMDVIDGWEP